MAEEKDLPRACRLQAAMNNRICKVLLLLCAVLYSTLVAFNNLTDYGSNFEFVRHVLMMDTTFPDNEGMWRAINIDALHHLAYILIILAECLIAVLGWVAVLRLWAARADAALFARSKDLANYSLTLGVVLWFGGFIVIGGEWFLMWQSESWNGIQAAFRIAVFFLLVMLYLNTED